MCENSNSYPDDLDKKYEQCMRQQPIVQTGEVYKEAPCPTENCEYLFKGYGEQNPTKNYFYRTVNSEYGYYTPNPHTVPTRFFPRTQKFSNDMSKCGMYRNYALNTQMDYSFY